MIEIRSRFGGQVLHAAETAQDVRAAVVQAFAAKSKLYGANLCRSALSGADLYGADLREADLSGADLRGANLRRADLREANLCGATLSGANLRGSYLGGADLNGANLRGADLCGADLYGANLGGADLYGANLRGADLGGADLYGAGILHVEGLPSGSATLIPDPDGWVLQIGCWSGTTTDLREMIDYDDGWPGAEGAQITERRPMLAALADMCDAWAESHSQLLAAVQETHWGKSD